jgi:hypothetical protein
MKVNKLQQFIEVLEIHENVVPFEDAFLHKPKPGSDPSESTPQTNVNLLFFVAVHFTRIED